jgi:hypothetical protein
MDIEGDSRVLELYESSIPGEHPPGMLAIGLQFET